MEDFKRFMFKRQNTDKSGSFSASDRDSTPKKNFNSWNNLESFDDDGLGSSGRLRPSTSLYVDDPDEEVDIPIIPDIEELQDQEFLEQPADAPTVEINRLDGLEELDKKVKKKPFLVNADNLDLTILATFILPEEKVRENDITWNWDKLINDIMYNSDIVALSKKKLAEEGKSKE